MRQEVFFVSENIFFIAIHDLSIFIRIQAFVLSSIIHMHMAMAKVFRRIFVHEFDKSFKTLMWKIVSVVYTLCR